jgi:hypothetical protein
MLAASCQAGVRGIGTRKAEARFERCAKVGTHRKFAMSAGEPVLNQSLRALRSYDGSLKLQELGFQQSLP